MMLARRTFLIGLASVLASPAIKSAMPLLEPISTATIPEFLRWRAIVDIAFSCMPTGEQIRAPEFREDPINYRFMRDGDVLYDAMLNPRASMRWVAAPGSEIIIPDKSLFGIQVEPAHTLATVTIICDIEKDQHPLTRRRTFAECYEWRDGALKLKSLNALHLQDAHLMDRS